MRRGSALPIGTFVGSPLVTYPHRVQKRLLPLVPVLLLALGCSASPDRSGADAAPTVDLAFDYFAVAETGMIDQTVTIANSSADTAAVPTLEFVALDGEGQPIEGVDVGTVFGSDRGLVVAPANYEVFDILRFDGVGADRVEDVEVVIESVSTFDESGTVYPEVEYLDGGGRAVPAPALARTVRVRNPGAHDYVVRLVGIQWNAPAPGRSQQARRVTPVGAPVAVPAKDTADVRVPHGLGGHLDSLKAYISTG